VDPPAEWSWRPRYAQGVADDRDDELSPNALGPNAWLVDEMHEQYLADPTSVSESWQDFFADYRRDAAPQTMAPAPAAASPLSTAPEEAPAPQPVPAAAPVEAAAA
jgi:2-oxoglutarate decarboxylase